MVQCVFDPRLLRVEIFVRECSFHLYQKQPETSQIKAATKRDTNTKLACTPFQGNRGTKLTPDPPRRRIGAGLCVMIMVDDMDAAMGPIVVAEATRRKPTAAKMPREEADGPTPNAIFLQSCQASASSLNSLFCLPSFCSSCEHLRSTLPSKASTRKESGNVPVASNETPVVYRSDATSVVCLVSSYLRIQTFLGIDGRAAASPQVCCSRQKCNTCMTPTLPLWHPMRHLRRRRGMLLFTCLLIPRQCSPFSPRRQVHPPRMRTT